MESADIVVIGGGVLGGAVAFYLAKLGVGHVVILERHEVAQGNSSLAAGLLTRGRLKPHFIPMVLETYAAIEEIEEINGEPLGMHQTGCLYVTVSPVQQKAIRELASVSSQNGLRVEWLDPADVKELVPWLKLPRDTSIIFMPDDGYIDGYMLTNGYIKAAHAFGAEVRGQTRALSICREGDRVTGVKTQNGQISASLVIDVAGVWAGTLAHEIGINLPMAPIRSHYWITESNRLFSPSQPFIILPDARAYARPESRRLLFGFREKESVSLNPHALPEKMNGYVFKQDPNGWESLLEGVPDFGKFFPAIEEIEIPTYIKGLSNYTPDGNLVLGEIPSLKGFLVATGCAGAGLAMSGGVGRFISDLVIDGFPFVDATPHRVDRFGEIDPFDPNFIRRCAEARSGKITG